jgi:cyanophycin synthetase
VAARAVAAAQMVGLDICGVDMVAETVLRPLEEQGGGFVEVNAAPGLRMHLAPSYGKPRNVGQAMVDRLFAHGDNGRIPVVAVTGTNGKTTTARLIAHLFTAQGLRVGMTNTDGVYVNGRQIDSGDCSGPKSARNVLLHPEVDAAVFETARGGILREGLGFDRCQVAVVTNIGAGDHLGLNYITTVEDLAVLKRVIVQNVATTGYAVLNATDPIVAAMASACPGKIIYFASDRHHPVMATHRAQGHRTVYVDGDSVVAAEGSWRETIHLRDVPITRNGKIGFQVENVMASVAAAWGAGLPWQTIRRGLSGFVNDSDNAPGRFNLMDFKGATVIADYGHNPDAMRALVQAVGALPAKRRSVVISGAGDRRDEDIREQTVILGAAFDDVILYQDAAQRGRGDGEVMALLREGLAGAARTRHVEEIRGEFIAIDTALDRLQPGDLCLVLVDQVEEALAHLARRCAEAGVAAMARADGQVGRLWLGLLAHRRSGLRCFRKNRHWDTPFSGSDNDIIVEAYDDPGVQGVTCYVSRARIGDVKGTLGLAEDRAEASIACRQVGAISIPEPLKKQEEVFSERMSILFKRLRIVRMVDPARNTLVYLTYSEKLSTVL